MTFPIIPSVYCHTTWRKLERGDCKCGSGKCGSGIIALWKMQEWKMREQTEGVENARVCPMDSQPENKLRWR